LFSSPALRAQVVSAAHLMQVLEWLTVAAAISV
jgi:hypothetical protein